MHGAVAVVVAFALVSSLFAFAGFSFGYLIGFYLYTMVLGYLWLNCFSDLEYDHRLGGLSAAASAIAFLLPALFIASPIPQMYAMSETAFDRLLMFILLLAVSTVAAGSAYNFRFVALENIYDFRDKMETPPILSYLIGITYSALLPFAFAGLAARKAFWRAGLALVLLLLFYPISLSKLAFFAPAWILFIALLSRIFETRTAAILSMFLPVLFGVTLVSFSRPLGMPYFNLVNFRMIAIPSNAMDIYYDFFSNHDLTYFCQIRFLKPIMHCAYRDPLSIVMAQVYDLGNYNASLLSTEGIASVGSLFAPISAFVCGLVIALGNRLSAGLPPRFILVSGAVLPLVFLNVPLTTGLLSQGAGIVFLLWYITPRTILEQKDGPQAVVAG